MEIGVEAFGPLLPKLKSICKVEWLDFVVSGLGLNPKPQKDSEIEKEAEEKNTYNGAIKGARHVQAS